ncbi:hypothetical protein CIB93_04960 [Streptomyces sp. WZ.A104]|uniref:hypothetical protein n=1 Tax=Streptomyces sp. WZ.A104 TaxID=2023771 RepID=UPI000BBBAA89|nr:hypothetical protein [Streptomyces sp. WZ.A104]PCG87191.1 hypothetical protein CIB93_04960 [Streptomyces sp. WZ.A104]
MSAHPLADLAAGLRSRTLAFLRSPVSREFWNMLVDRGHTFVMPAAWSALPRSRQIEGLLAAEGKRVSDGTTFAMANDLVRAAREIGQDQSIPLPFTPDVLPAPSGMLVFSADEPLAHLPTGLPVVAVTWGPPMDGFSPGVHLTWWAPMREEDQEEDAAARGRLIPIVPDFDLHLSFLPHFDTRLHRQQLPSGLIYSAVPLRSVVAAWYALTADGTTLREERPQATVTQALKELKAKKRGVQVATTSGAGTAHRGITDRAAQTMRDLDGADYFDPAPELAATTKKAEHGVFDVTLDHQLDAGHRRLAHIYREAADHWHRLEMQVTQRYPGIFEGLEELRAQNSSQWQPWCWMPSIRVSAWLIKMYDAPIEQASWDGPRIAALGAWRSGGRHSVLTTLPLQATASGRVPAELTETMPAPGLGLVIDDNGTVHLMLAYLDEVDDRGTADAELVLISNYGQPTRMLEDITKLTVFLSGDTLLDAVKATQAYYDHAAVQNGTEPHPTDEALYAEHAYALSLFTGVLAGICTPGAELQDAGALTGRKLPAPWPPEPNVLSETTLWLLTGTPAAR